MTLLNRIIIMITALAVTLSAKAQSSYRGDIATPVDSTATISLLTVAPGCEIYELEGHTGLRIRTASDDMVANWGLFDFSAPNFVYRFVKGETDYCVGLWPYGYFMALYREENRRVTEQVLDLTPEETAHVISLVNDNLRKENRIYRYNYVLDNCATRPLAIIEKAAGDSIRFSIPEAMDENATSFRNVMRIYHRNYPWYQFGIDLALGSGIDRQISVRETGFAPVVLEKIAAAATIGNDRPLVKSETVLFNAPENGTVKAPTPCCLTPMAIFCALAAICLIYAIRAARRKSICPWINIIVYSILGLNGLVLTFLIFISSHEATSPNWNYLWINPSCLLVPVLIRIPSAKRFLRGYMSINICLMALYFIIVLFGIQSPNPAFYPILLADLILSSSYLQITRDNNN
ncbi:MAG: DUF4105 domain-containing protein [Paramuribaculum sp.]|nr:DUF4105 domain-containing protein [Paramuribaculum sp.]